MKLASPLAISFAIFVLAGPASAITLNPSAYESAFVQQISWRGHPWHGHDWVWQNGMWFSPGVGPNPRCVDVRFGCSDRWGWDGGGFRRCVWRHGC